MAEEERKGEGGANYVNVPVRLYHAPNFGRRLWIAYVRKEECDVRNVNKAIVEKVQLCRPSERNCEKQVTTPSGRIEYQ
jgi:hypothetical protein